MLQALEEPAVSRQDAIAITESISDWLDEDEETSRAGAEDAYYVGRTPAYRAGNRLMSSVSELRAVANMTPAIYRALSPWVTALPGTAQLNVFTAPPMVLRTLNADNDLSPLSMDDAITLRESGFEDINGLLNHPVFSDRKDRMAEIKPTLGRNSNYFLLTARVEVAGKQMRLYSVLERRNRTVSAVARARGSPCPEATSGPRTGENTVEKFCAIPL